MIRRFPALALALGLLGMGPAAPPPAPPGIANEQRHQNPRGGGKTKTRAGTKPRQGSGRGLIRKARGVAPAHTGGGRVRVTLGRT